MEKPDIVDRIIKPIQTWIEKHYEFKAEELPYKEREHRREVILMISSLIIISFLGIIEILPPIAFVTLLGFITGYIFGTERRRKQTSLGISKQG